jgi:hypothetical protein
MTGLRLRLPVVAFRVSSVSFHQRFLPLVVLALLATVSCRALEVAVTQRAPLESISAAGEVTGVSEAQIGARYTLVSGKDGQVLLRDAQGNQFQIAATATDYTPPALAATAAPAPAPAPAVMNAAPAVSTNVVYITTSGKQTNVLASSAPLAPAPAPAAAPTAPTAASDSVGGPTPAAINAALGKPFFTDQPIWTETALMIAQRVGLGLEGRTQWEASYRRYFTGQPDDAKSIVLGSPAYCVAIYADADDHPTSLLIAFDNDGDFRGIGQVAADLSSLAYEIYGRDGVGDHSEQKLQYDDKFSAMETTFEPLRLSEQASLTAKLTGLLGPPQQTSFGSDPTTREDTLRWDWNGTSFLLTCQPNKYNLLRIVPTGVADNNGRMPRISRDDIGHRLSGAVVHRDNGDVIITQIPMADQGPKGYCVPATWERVLRYTGVPGDMYTLSRIGGAHFGGGEWGIKIAEELDKTLYDYGRHVEVLHPTHLDYVAIRHYIDDGIPIFWAVNIHGYDAPEQRYSLCDRDKDFDTWKKLLAQARATPDTTPLRNDGGHQVLIIGYNPDTKEIAWTDPWGKTTQERWMTQEEAQRCTLNEYYTISW